MTIVREQHFEKKKKGIVKSEFVQELNENGDAVFTLDIAQDESQFSLEATIGSQKTDLGQFYTFDASDTSENDRQENNSLTAKVFTEK